MSARAASPARHDTCTLPSQSRRHSLMEDLAMGRVLLKAEVRDATRVRPLAELRELEDTALVNVYLDGETRGFDVLVERYQTRLLNFVYRIVGDRERA